MSRHVSSPNVLFIQSAAVRLQAVWRGAAGRAVAKRRKVQPYFAVADTLSPHSLNSMAVYHYHTVLYLLTCGRSKYDIGNQGCHLKLCKIAKTYNPPHTHALRSQAAHVA